ncbi:MAG: hypothetical protein HY678_08210 [Chloroflexi bacterium]|nr:hypothetical protein [Chloroflexota bacterium]
MTASPIRPFTLIAHRGFSSRVPENTLPAFDLALESGIDNFELDAQLTKDGVVVVIHDATVDRTTDGRGPVAGFTSLDLQMLDAGSRFGDARQYAGTRIPTLRQILERYRGRAHIHLELKSTEAELPAMVAALLKDTGWLEYATGGPFKAPGITLTSFSFEQLKRSRKLLPQLRHGWLIQEIDDRVLAAARDAGIAGVYPRAENVSRASVSRAIEGDFSVRGWGVRNEADLRQLVESGAQGTTVDWPDVAKEILARPAG